MGVSTGLVAVATIAGAPGTSKMDGHTGAVMSVNTAGLTAASIVRSRFITIEA